MSKLQDLQTVKADDLVFVEGSRSTDIRRLVKVERVTKASIFAGGERFNKMTGRMIGSTMWFGKTISVATPEEIKLHVAQRNRKKTIRFIEQFDFTLLNDDQLTRMVAIIRETPGCESDGPQPPTN
jgi:hypothetical protein